MTYVILQVRLTYVILQVRLAMNVREKIITVTNHRPIDRIAHLFREHPGQLQSKRYQAGNAIHIHGTLWFVKYLKPLLDQMRFRTYQWLFSVGTSSIVERRKRREEKSIIEHKKCRGAKRTYVLSTSESRCPRGLAD
jgi:hypothetical protein